MASKYQPVIGLEVHVELRTESKMFCSCPSDHFGKVPNTQTCPVCIGLPGALPVPNEKAIRWAQLLGAALGCTLVKKSHFDRKHYFYPDLPKGYQISQYDSPLARNGKWKMDAGRWIKIRRVHLEEDTGKLLHQTLDGKNVTLVDFNRSGVALVEIVTEPDFTSASEAKEFLQEIQQVVRYLGISDADMEKGSMRLEANINLKTKKVPHYKVEVKNINSFRFLEQAINYEIERQTKAVDDGEKLMQETRGFDEKTGTTKLQRTKEEAHDYRYFPEPDIPPFSFKTSYITELIHELPEMPKSKSKRFEEEYELPGHYAILLTQTRAMADYFEEAVKVGKEHNVPPKKIADVLVNKKPNINEILPAKLVEMLRAESEKPLLSNEELEKVVDEVISKNPKIVEDYKKGKENVLQFLIGQVMSKTRGQADPAKVKSSLIAKL